jgi:Cytochrome P460
MHASEPTPLRARKFTQSSEYSQVKLSYNFLPEDQTRLGQRRSMMRNTILLVAAALICGVGYVETKTSAGAQTEVGVKRASFNADGSVNLPTGYRQWFHIGTRFKPIGINILDFLPTKTPEIFNAYVEPKAMSVFEATGKWPEGTQIVKEFSTVKTGENCDEKTSLCTTELGTGIYEAGFIGLGMMVKDRQRFPNAPGNWGFFSFGHKPPPYDPTSVLQSEAKCAACHVKLAADTDYVISKAHIGLARQ